MFLCVHKCLTSCSILWHWKELFIIPHKSFLQAFLFSPHILIKGWLWLFRSSSKQGFPSATCISGAPACCFPCFACSGWGFPMLSIKTVAVPCPADLHCFTGTDSDELVVHISYQKQGASNCSWTFRVPVSIIMSWVLFHVLRHPRMYKGKSLSAVLQAVHTWSLLLFNPLKSQQKTAVSFGCSG